MFTDIKKGFKAQLITVIVCGVFFIGNYIVRLVQNDGKDKIKEVVAEEIEKQFSNPVLIAKFLDNPQIKNFAKEQRLKTLTEQEQSQSKKVQLRALLMLKMGIAEDEVHIEVGKMYKYYLELPKKLKELENTRSIREMRRL